MFFSNALFLFAQSNEVPKSSNTQREEVHRYMGYEILPYRYLSLPYDVSVNVNEKQVFVDIGFMYFAFLPLLLIATLLRRPRLAIIVTIATLFTWMVGAANSFVFSQNVEGKLIKGKAGYVDFLLGDLPFRDNILDHIVAYIHYIAIIIYEPLLSITNVVSGNADSWTYPFLLLLFTLSIILIVGTLEKVSIEKKSIIIVFWVLLFFWFKYSAGIVWYGFLPILLAALVIVILVQRKSTSHQLYSQFLKYSFFSVASTWVILAIMFRMGEIHNGAPEKDLGKAMFSNLFFEYQLGTKSSKEVLNGIYPNFDKTLSLINSNDSKILRIGTSFSYFIKNNDKRIQLDNQLGLFHRVYLGFNEDQKTINEAFKASGFRYIIVDVNTPYIDQTPEQTLKKKYDELMKYIKDNNGLKLMNTNRIFQEISPQSGKYELYYKMFPTKGRQAKIYYGGQYAIYEIL